MSLFAALVFTDVEGSTALWDRHASAFGGALARHDAILREAVARHGGHELATMGDAFAVRFATVAHAAAFCADGQAALAAEAWAVGPVRVRMGVHWGEVGPDPLSGATAALAERVAGAGHGGQILLSEAARSALPAEQGPVQPLGAFALKGLPGRHGLWQLGPGEFPPPRARGKAGNLAPRAERLVGRQAERATLSAWWAAGERLVALIGPGGVGKTHLAEVIALEALEAELDGAWRISLSDARDAEALTAAVTTALEVPPGRDPVEQIGLALAGRGRALLILDAVERLPSDVWVAVSRWLARAPELRVLLTSRVTTGLRAERALRLDPLPPDDALALFIERSGGADAATPALLAGLEGLPLAIELAAARARGRPAQVALDALVARADAVGEIGPDEQISASLRACMAWSWELLPEDAADAMSCLSVFVGGFDLAAAEALLGWDALDLVQILVEQSWLRLDRATGRYAALDSAIAFAAARGAPERIAEAEALHLKLFAARAVELTARIHRVERDELRRLSEDLPNLMAASRRAAAAGLGQEAGQTARAIWALRWRVGPGSDALQFARAAIALLPVGDPLRLALESIEIRVLRMTGDTDVSLALLGQRIESAERLGYTEAEVELRVQRASAWREMGLFTCSFDELRRAFEVLGDRDAPLLRATILGTIGILSHESNDPARAATSYTEALRLQTSQGALELMMVTLGNLANLHRNQGQLETARRRYEEALSLARRLGDRRQEALAIGNMGLLLRDTGDLAGARVAMETAAETHLQLGVLRSAGIALGNLGEVLVSLGEPRAAVERLERALALLAQVADRRASGAFLAGLGTALVGAGRLAEAWRAFDRAEHELRAVGIPTMVLYANAHRALALLEAGELDAARSRARAVLDQADHLGSTLDAPTQALLERVRRILAR